STLVRSEIKSLTFHSAIVTVHFIQLTPRGLVVIPRENAFSRPFGEYLIRRVSVVKIVATVTSRRLHGSSLP
ncbi:hypothetical protein X777_09146, partial [Ooceraea biroi]